MPDLAQEAIALFIVVCAAAYLVRKLTGWPHKSTQKEPPVIVGSKLKRALKKRTSNNDCH